MHPLLIITLAFFVTTIGALPFGLVNLSVLNTSYRKNQAAAMQISHGAALVEVFFGLTAFLAGGIIGQLIKSNQAVYFVVLSVPAIAGLYFLIKKSPAERENNNGKQGFIKGVVLNLISVQVFLFWLFAMTYINTVWEIRVNVYSIVLLAGGIWLGKMGTLWIYAFFSEKIFSSFGFLSRNINRIIGVVLLVTVLVQLIKTSSIG